VKGFSRGAQCGDGVIAHGEAMGFSHSGSAVEDSARLAESGVDQESVVGFRKGGKVSRKGKKLRRVMHHGKVKYTDGKKIINRPSRHKSRMRKAGVD